MQYYLAYAKEKKEKIKGRKGSIEEVSAAQWDQAIKAVLKRIRSANIVQKKAEPFRAWRINGKAMVEVAGVEPIFDLRLFSFDFS